MGANNFVDLQRECIAKDPAKKGYIVATELFNCFSNANMNVLPREFEEL
jgi:hypothetical protein